MKKKFYKTKDKRKLNSIIDIDLARRKGEIAMYNIANQAKELLKPKEEKSINQTSESKTELRHSLSDDDTNRLTHLLRSMDIIFDILYSGWNQEDRSKLEKIEILLQPALEECHEIAQRFEGFKKLI